MTSTLPTAHSAFLKRARLAVEADPRLTAMMIGGSYLDGGMDEYSDLDIVLVAEDGAYDEVLADRRSFAAGLAPLVCAFSGEHVGEPRLLICLYGPELLHVDLKFVNLAGLDRLVERPAILFARHPALIETALDRARIDWPDMTPVWFEGRAWIWLHYASLKLARGELFEAIGMLAFLREQILGPMMHRRAGRPQRGVRRLEQMDLDSDGRLARTAVGHDRGAVAGALRTAVELYLDLRSDCPPHETAPGMPDALTRFIESQMAADPT